MINIYVGGAVSERSDFIQRIQEKIDELVMLHPISKIRPIVERCEFKNDANLIGAVYHYKQEYEDL